MGFSFLKPIDDVPEEELIEDMDIEEAESVTARSFSIKEKLLMTAVGLCALLLAVVIFISLPYFGKKPQTAADPESVLHQSYVQEEQELKEEPMVEVPEETTEPTIPPEANPYTQFDFQYNRNNYLICTKQDSYPGVDVSLFQGNIDWNRVAKSGIKFAMVRLGYRGYGQKGNMVVDELAQANLEGAANAGLEVGAYFFSQATSLREVSEEIDLMLEVLGDFPLTMPLVLDWEIPNAEARTVNVDRRTLTDCLKFFCEVVTEKGYHPMIYFNWGQAKRLIYLNELEDYPFWLALYQDRMTFPYRVEMWQYTCTGRVPGIDADVDINVFMPDLRAK